ncbi:UDP-glucose 4-epimerase GalE [Melioribacteraceae bacterium 4301-Me]|uniref:UDP-glucose 4-epimerase GalE n=1 Tax=Pyranulibacter aquaticus TaxID=3163344 RepID=UPI003598CC9C
MKQIKNILITGGAGYIGSHVAHDLVELGYNVFVFDNFTTGLKENVPKTAVTIEGDIRKIEDLQKLFTNEFDVVFHFAAFKAAGDSMNNPINYAENNICGTLNIIKQMLLHNINFFVFSSSAAVYGEPRYLPIDEKHPKNPTNYYGFTKLIIEQNLEWFSKLNGIKYAALRYFNATGYDIKGRVKGKEKNPANLSPIVMETAANIRESMQVFGNDYETVDGTCIRDFIHVNDLSSAHILAMDYLYKKNENIVVNLGTGTGHSVLEVIAAAEKVTNRKINYSVVNRRKGDPKELVASCQLAKELLGWEAKYSDLETIFTSMKPVYGIK